MNSQILKTDKYELSLKVQILGDTPGAMTTGQIRVQHWSPPQRLSRALKLGTACWSGAAIAILIPFLHFLLVPALLIAGPIVAFIIYGQESVILGGEGLCPNCNATLPIARTSYEFPVSDLCSKCQYAVKIEPLATDLRKMGV